MIAIVCVDDDLGMMFNQRRQSKDKNLIADICTMIGKEPLFIDPYSRSLFGEEKDIHLISDPAFLQKVPRKGYCFVETETLKEYEEEIEQLVLYRWNRRYPQDQRLGIILQANKWKKISERELQGNSHQNITKEIYKNEKL